MTRAIIAYVSGVVSGLALVYWGANAQGMPREPRSRASLGRAAVAAHPELAPDPDDVAVMARAVGYGHVVPRSGNGEAQRP